MNAEVAVPVIAVVLLKLATEKNRPCISQTQSPTPCAETGVVKLITAPKMAIATLIRVVLVIGSFPLSDWHTGCPVGRMRPQRRTRTGPNDQRWGGGTLWCFANRAIPALSDLRSAVRSIPISCAARCKDMFGSVSLRSTSTCRPIKTDFFARISARIASRSRSVTLRVPEWNFGLSSSWGGSAVSPRRRPAAPITLAALAPTRNAQALQSSTGLPRRIASPKRATAESAASAMIWRTLVIEAAPCVAAWRTCFRCFFRFGKQVGRGWVER
jgi:hypothetical protein